MVQVASTSDRVKDKYREGWVAESERFYPNEQAQQLLQADETRVPKRTSSLLAPLDSIRRTLSVGRSNNLEGVRLAVRVVSANILIDSGKMKGQKIDPFIRIACQLHEQKTLVIKNNKEPVWNEFFRFNINHPANAKLRLQLLNHKWFGRNGLLGHTDIKLQNIINGEYPFGKQIWFQMKSNVASQVNIQLEFYCLTQRLERPLRALASTWNVSGPLPEDDLSRWVEGLDKSGREYDIVAVAVQECSYTHHVNSTRQSSHQLSKLNANTDGYSPFDGQNDQKLPDGVNFDAQRALTTDDDEADSDEQSGNPSSGNTKQMLPSTEFSHKSRGHNYYKQTKLQDFSQAVFTQIGESQQMFLDRLQLQLGDNYWLIRAGSVGRIRLAVFARRQIYAAISGVVKATKATGVASVGTNKGGVAIAFKVWDTEMCFVCSHLAAHQTKIHERNQMYRELVKGLAVDEIHDMCLCTRFHHCVWMGDLNYRVDYPVNRHNESENQESPDSFEFDAFSLLLDEDPTQLQQYDQLNKERKTNGAFSPFSEGRINFMPTFKCKKNNEKSIYNPKRLPAWTDRILCRSNIPSKKIVYDDYFSIPELAASDHKPIAAALQIPLVDFPANSATSIDTTKKANFIMAIQQTRIQLTDLQVNIPECQNQLISEGGMNIQLIFSSRHFRFSNQLQSRTLKQTNNPMVWSETIILKLKGELKDQLDSMVFVKVVSLSHSRDDKSDSKYKTLAHGTMVFEQFQQKIKQKGDNKGNKNNNDSNNDDNSKEIVSVPLNVQLLKHGIPAGNLTGLMSYRHGLSKNYSKLINKGSNWARLDNN